MKIKIFFWVLAVIVTAVGLYIWMGQTQPVVSSESVRPETNAAEKKTLIDSPQQPKAPRIQSQQFSDASENPAYSLPGSPVVTTESGESITLDLLFEMPPADKGIYRYGNELYTYDMHTAVFTHIPNGDAATFKIVPGAFSFNLYAKDKSQVYCRGEILAGADATTFTEIPDWSEALNNRSMKYVVPDRGSYTNYLFYQDKNHQYVFGECSPYTP